MYKQPDVLLLYRMPNSTLEVRWVAPNLPFFLMRSPAITFLYSYVRNNSERVKMGQYYMIANLDKKEFLYPHKMGSGLKLLEIACCNLPRVLVLLLQDSDGRGGGDGDIDNPVVAEFCGRWAGDRIAIVGDYDSKGIYNKFNDIESEDYEPDWVDISFPTRFAYETWMDVGSCRLHKTWGSKSEWEEYLKTRGEDLPPNKSGADGSLRPDIILKVG